MGPWIHTGNLTAYQGELNFGLLSQGLGEVAPATLKFFDQHLKGIEAGLPQLRYFLMGAKQWRNAEDWPPAGAVHQSGICTPADKRTLPRAMEL
jgi:hypothetical protein